MKKMYFTLDEDFNKIIKNVLRDKDVISIKQITTGWTNIVHEVETNLGTFFFRFPRDEFWSRTIVKDCEFANFIIGKTDFETVELKLKYDGRRPFSIHKKIEGTVLADKINKLTLDEVKAIASDLAKFMAQLHNVKYDKEKIFKNNNIGLNLVDFLDELLRVHVCKKDMEFWEYDKFSKKDNNCLVHGDFNLSNVILDEKNKLKAVIDFGFAGYGNKYFDIARIMSRECPQSFKNELIKKYEEFSNDKIYDNILDDEINIWKKIDSAYINYMRTIGIYK